MHASQEYKNIDTASVLAIVAVASLARYVCCVLFGGRLSQLRQTALNGLALRALRTLHWVESRL